MGLDGQFTVQLATAQNLNSIPSALDYTGFPERLFVNHGPVGKSIQPRHINRRQNL
jgi:hypothetical protein